MAAPTVKVYGPPMSTAVSRVLACLLEKDVQFQLIPVNMAKGEHRSPEFLKLHPFGQVPAFQDGDNISLFESRAICRYVCEKYGDKGNKELYGRNPLAKASIDQWLEAEAQNFNPPSSTMSKEKLAKVLDVYDKRLAESRFLAGDHFSLADLSHLPNAHYLLAAPDAAPLFTSPNVARWWDEISSRDSWKKVVDLQRAAKVLQCLDNENGSG
ncbi:hypothetical protein VNO80_02081 [Phaseolus coccineus]|uniref:glutathione transferase n=1 Tax=Phaseolus coccineus TaxID=3886 RepID=A0AAN9RML2_PHACN